MCVISLVPTLASLDVLGPLFQHASLLRCKLDKVCLLWRKCTEGRAPCWWCGRVFWEETAGYSPCCPIPIPASKVTWDCKSYWDLPSHLFWSSVKQIVVAHNSMGKLIKLRLKGTAFDSLLSLLEG